MAERMLAYHFDLKRAMWTRDYMDATVDRVKGWGFNAIVYEIEDKFRFLKHPAISHPEAPSREETADFVAACRDQGVQVIPLMQSLGHAECVVGKPEYAHLRESSDVDSQYDPLSEEARALIIELYDEIIDVFQPEQYFHVGGDEAWSLGKSRKCAPVVEEIGVGGLYLGHMLPLFEHLKGRGLRPIIWDDILLTYPEIICRVPKDVVIMDWDYWMHEERPREIIARGAGEDRRALRVNWTDYQELEPAEPVRRLVQRAVDERTPGEGTFRPFHCVDALLDEGFDVITASAARSGGDMTGTPAHAKHLPNCFYSARKGVNSALGNLVTSWAVRHNHPELSLPGAFAAAHALRAEGAFDADAFGRAFTADFYGAAMPEFADAVQKAQVSFALGQAGIIKRAHDKFNAGEDPLPEYVAMLEEAEGGRSGAVGFLKTVLAGYAEARTAFTEMKAKAVRNAESIAFWLEGIELNILYADFMLAALKGTLDTDAPKLLERIPSLRENTRTLFAGTYTPQSVEAEVEKRYAFHERFLRKLLGDSDY